MDHIIRRQILELSIDGRQQPFDLQNRLSDYYYHAMLPLLEKVFDELSGEEDVLYIDRLELDLGVFSGKEFDAELLKERLTEKLHSLDLIRSFRSARPPSSTGRRTTTQNAFEQWIWYMEKGYLPWTLSRIGKDWENKVLELLATDYNGIGRLREILQTNETVLTRIIRQQDESFLVTLVEILTAVRQERLQQAIKDLCLALEHLSRNKGSSPGKEPRSAVVKNRLSLMYKGSLSSLHEDLWRDLLLLAARMGKEGSTDSLLITLLTSASRGTGDETGNKELVAALLTALAEELKLPSLLSLAGHLISRSSGKAAAHSRDIPSSSGDKAGSKGPAVREEDPGRLPGSPGGEREGAGSDKKSSREEPGQSGEMVNRQAAAGEEISGQSGQREQASASPDPAGPQPRTDQTTPLPSLTDEPGSLSGSRREEEDDNMPDEEAFQAAGQKIGEEGLFVQYAGVVLTHPFLHTLFKKTGLVEKGKFVHARAQQKGLYLLHYLATGRGEAEEHELVIPKILCGWPLEEPVKKRAGMTKKAWKDADELLEGLIRHWDVKNISVEGLRGNFLARSGKLYTKEERLHLIIEKHPVDILIRTFPFPWNMSIIKLPWQGPALHLEW